MLDGWGFWGLCRSRFGVRVGFCPAHWLLPLRFARWAVALDDLRGSDDVGLPVSGPRLSDQGRHLFPDAAPGAPVDQRVASDDVALRSAVAHRGVHGEDATRLFRAHTALQCRRVDHGIHVLLQRLVLVRV